MRVLALSVAFLLLASPAATAQKPDTVFFENLTFDEIRELIKGGTKTVIVATGSTGDNGPHLPLGSQSLIATYTADKIARALGNTLVAPVIAYTPGGSRDTVKGYQDKSGTISLPDDSGFTELLEAAATSVKASGFKTIVLIGNASESQHGLKVVAEKLDPAWKGAGVRVVYLSDYYARSQADQTRYLIEKLGVNESEAGSAGIVDTSEVMAIKPQSVRLDKLEKSSPSSGVREDATKATPQLGQALLKIKIDNAVAQFRQWIANGSN